MADRIVVMCEGRILQVGTPMDLYERPANVFTARFIGSPTMNILPGRVTIEAGQSVLAAGGCRVPLSRPPSSPSSAVLVGVRPQELRVMEKGDAAELVFSGTAAVIEPLGSETFVHVDCGDRLLLASAPAKSPPRIGEAVRVGASSAALRLFDTATEEAL